MDKACFVHGEEDLGFGATVSALWINEGRLVISGGTAIFSLRIIQGWGASERKIFVKLFQRNTHNPQGDARDRVPLV